MTIIYLTFGEKMEYHVQAYLSMLSFRRQIADTDHIVMVTTAPQMYRHVQDWVEVITIDDQTIKEWQGEYQFFWRVKIKVIEWIGQRYPDDDLLWLDCDTVLSGSIDWLKQQLAAGHGLMDRDEGHPSRMKTKTLRMWKMVAGRTYGDVTLGLRHDMYCAGVVGIPCGKREQVVNTALALCDGMLSEGAERIVIEQYSLSVALFEKVGSLVETKDCIAHYWSMKEEWMEAAHSIIAKSFLQGSMLDEELRFFDEIDWKRIPVFAHKSNTARRVKGFIDRIFPSRNLRYVE